MEFELPANHWYPQLQPQAQPQSGTYDILTFAVRKASELDEQIRQLQLEKHELIQSLQDLEEKCSWLSSQNQRFQSLHFTNHVNCTTCLTTSTTVPAGTIPTRQGFPIMECESRVSHAGFQGWPERSKEPDLCSNPHRTAYLAESLAEDPANEYILPQWSDIPLPGDTEATFAWRTDNDNSTSSLPLHGSRGWSEGNDDGHRGSLASSTQSQSHNDHNLEESNEESNPDNLTMNSVEFQGFEVSEQSSTIDDSLLTLTSDFEGSQQPIPPSSPPSSHFPVITELKLSNTNLRAGFNTSGPKWRLDMYIGTLQELLKRAELHSPLTTDLCHRITTEGILWIVREAWPKAETFWKVTASFQGFLQAELWRNFPSRTTYNLLHPAYRPTRRQLTVPHSAIIDWLPWPDLRDQVILYQDQIDVDVVCKTAIENNVSHRRSATTRVNRNNKNNKKRCRTEPATALTSFRVWGLCLLEQQSGNTSPATSDLTYKPQSASVVSLEKAYDLEYDNFTTQRLHPQFFHQYPFLYCESAETKFRVQEVPVVVDEDVGTPVQLSMASVLRLRQVIEDKVGISIAI